MADENPNARWRQMTEAEAKLAAKDQAKAVKASNRVADGLEDMKDQFKAMHQDLDKLQAATHTENTEKKKEKKEERNESKALLNNLRAEVRRSQIAQGLSAKDVAAEHLASGGGIGGAIGAAAGFKIEKLKHKFDPLNIINKITGGSKLITALAGKVMGRSEASIRKFADLAPGQDLPTSFSGKASRVSGGYNEGPSKVSSGDSSGLLVKVAKDVSQILAHIMKMESYTEKQARLAQDQLDEQKDATALAGAKAPSRVGKIIDKIKGGTKEAGGGIMDFLSGLIDKFKLPLLVAMGLLVTAGVMLAAQWKNLKISFGLLKQSAIEMWDGVKNAFMSAGEWISKTALKVTDTVQDMFDDIIEYIQDLVYKFTGHAFGKPAATAAEKQSALETDAKAGNGRAMRKLAAQNTEKMAAPGESAAAVAKLSDSFTGKVPAAAQGTVAEGLKKGEYDAAATSNLMGGAPSGTPEQKATTNAVTQLASKAYGEVYKDETGKPLTPSTDMSPQKASRVAEMVRESSRALGVSLSSPQATAASPTEVPATVPMTGKALSDSSEFQKSAVSGGGDSNISKSTVNVRNNNSSQTSVFQGMAPARSGESSFLRSIDRQYAHG